MLSFSAGFIIFGVGSYRLTASLTWAICFIILFIIGGATGLVLAKCGSEYCPLRYLFCSGLFSLCSSHGGCYHFVFFFDSLLSFLCSYSLNNGGYVGSFWSVMIGAEFNFLSYMHTNGIGGLFRRYAQYPDCFRNGVLSSVLGIFMTRFNIITCFFALLKA